MRQIGIDVKGKPVQRRPAGQVNANSTDLSFNPVPRSVTWQPYPRIARVPLRSQAEVGARTNDHLFQRSDVAVDVSKELFQIKKWISDQLTRAMVSNIPPRLIL